MFDGSGAVISLAFAGQNILLGIKFRKTDAQVTKTTVDNERLGTWQVKCYFENSKSSLLNCTTGILRFHVFGSKVLTPVSLIMKLHHSHHCLAFA
ncbi:hypothetical protein D918_09639 [Trichuris suis]|nr:hypothetical protein D918_09639 [Trichuris suis]